MRIRQVRSLKGGEVLAESVVTEEKEVLITKGTVLKPEYLDLLSFLGIDTVNIEDPYVQFENPHQFMKKEIFSEYVNRVKKILENHIYNGKDGLREIEPLAQDIIHDMMNVDERIVIDFEERDGNLYEHTIMVTFLSIAVAKKLKLSEEEIRTIALGCLLHDLGLRYITVPYINYDPEKRTMTEAFEFKKHSILAYSALEHELWLNDSAKRMILSHHERKDGSGFPLHQKTKEIECNILQVCDAFDCLVSGMECKRTNVQAALEYIIEAADVLYEKKVVKAIEKMIARYPVGTKVRLNTGDTGVVITQTEDTIHPIVAVLNEDETIGENYYNLKKSKNVSILTIME